MSEYRIAFCTHCGKQLKPLATTLYCPNDCDRIPKPLEFEITEPIKKPQCSKCKSHDTEVFATAFWTGTHCITCGHVR